ncbi:MAG: hypothetical protein HNEKOMLI_00011 [Sodalis sp. Psp]|nr:hypothetical protein [Sodalis sp. Psp]MCR3756519.1 hypothetical protein [Sodalis sp. Ppy]
MKLDDDSGFTCLYSFAVLFQFQRDYLNWFFRFRHSPELMLKCSIIMVNSISIIICSLVRSNLINNLVNWAIVLITDYITMGMLLYDLDSDLSSFMLHFRHLGGTKKDHA